METGVVKYDVTEAALEKMQEYLELTITGIDDEAGFSLVHQARMVVKGHRVAVEKRRKELKADALEWGRKVDSEAKRLYGLMEPVEIHLQAEEDKVTKEKETIKAEKARKEKERVETILCAIEKIKGFVVTSPTVPSGKIQALIDELVDIDVTKDVFQEFVEEAYIAKQSALTGLVKAFEDRVTWERAEGERKAEAERLAKEKKAQDAREKALAEERAKMEAEKAELERAKKEERERQERAEFERKTREEAKARAEHEAKEKADREAKQAKREAECLAAEKARQEVLRPDKEKLLAYAEKILTIPEPLVKSDAADRIIRDVKRGMKGIAAMITKEVEAL